MTDGKLTNTDSKIWKWFTKNVIPLGDPMPSDSPPKPVLDFSEEVEKLSNQPKPKKKAQPGYQARLDLHGMTRDEAYRYLEVQLLVYKTRGYSCVLVITGKGHGKGEGLGILKRKVPLWFDGVKFNKIVKSYREAAPQHGGSGALYVYLT